MRRVSASFAAQILVLFAVASVVPLLGSLVESRGQEVAAERQAFRNAQVVASAAARQFDDLMGDARQAARVVSGLPAFWDGDDAARDEILSVLSDTQPAFSGLTYFTADFRQHGRSHYDPAVGRLDYSVRAYAREAVATGQLAVTDEVLVGLTTGNVIVTVALPVREDAAPFRAGFLIVSLKLDEIPNIWAKVPLPTGGAVTLVDTRAGRILAGSPDILPHVNETIPPARLERIRVGESVFRDTETDDAELLWAWQPVADTPWIVMVGTPGAAVFGPIYAEALRRMLGTLALTIVAFGLLFMLWRRLTSRLGLLQAAAGYWARGDWTHRAGLGGRDELSQLGQAFDHMATQVEESECARQQAEVALREARTAEARLEGVTLTARELAHRLNNELQTPIAVLELLQAGAVTPREQPELVSHAIASLVAAGESITQFQRVVRVATRETPVGPALDLERSLEGDKPSVSVAGDGACAS